MTKKSEYRRIAHIATRNIVRRMGTEVIKSKKDKRQRSKLYKEITSEVRKYYDE